MAYHDVRLSVSIERDAIGGPRFNTSIVTLHSGAESRNANWAAQRGEWNIAFPYSETTFAEVRAHFYARRGMLHSFPFRDWSDYTIGTSASPQTIGTGDGADATFQIYKRYSDGVYTYDRDITKPVTSGFAVYVNGVLKTVTTHYTIGATTGIITFTGGNEPAIGHAVAVYGEFNVPVRYGADAYDVMMTTPTLGSVPSLTIIEVKGE